MQEEFKHRPQDEQLINACQRGSLEDCKKLLGMGADANCKDKNGCTALFHCCHPQQLKLVRFLLNSGLDPNAANIRGNTALHIAAERGYKEIILILILYGADPSLYNLSGHRCDDLNPEIRQLIAAISRDKSAFGLLSENHRKKLTQIFEDIDWNEAGFIDAAKSIKFNRLVDDVTEEAAKKDAQLFLSDVSICSEGQVNLEEWLLSFGKVVRQKGNDEDIEEFIKEYESGVKEKGKFADFKPRD